MLDYEDEDEVEIETELEDSDFTEEHGESPHAWYSSCYATKRPMTAHNDIKFSTQGVRSKTRRATSSLTTEVARTSFLVYWWLLEGRDGATPSPLHYWVGQKRPLHRGNRSLSCTYFNWQVL